MERHHAYKASDGTLHTDSRKWAEHEFHLLLMTCSMNASKEEAAEVLDRFEDFKKVYIEFESDVKYGEGGRKGLVLDRRTIVKDPVPEVDMVESPDFTGGRAPLDQPVGVGTGMKLGGALDDVAF